MHVAQVEQRLGALLVLSPSVSLYSTLQVFCCPLYSMPISIASLRFCQCCKGVTETKLFMILDMM